MDKTYFDMEDLPQKPQEKPMQAAEKEQLDRQQQEAQEDAAQHAPDVARQERQQFYPQPSGSDSVFYPLVEAVRTALLKECKYDPPTPENAASLKSAMVVLEDKYRLYRVGPELMAGAYFVSPFVSGYAIHIKTHPPGFIKKKPEEPPRQEAAAPDSRPEPQVSPAAPAPVGASQPPQAGSAQQRAMG